jgi:branched-chain amino acid transport system ATP-binding protein
VTAALEIQNLNKSFGALAVARDINLALPKGARHALIGPNGAGKTTLVNLITGVLQPSAGRVLLDGQDITALPQAARTRRGIARTFQINQLFGELTPLQSLALSVSAQLGLSAQWWKQLGTDARVAPRCDTLLKQFHLDDVMDQQVKHLAYGKRRLLEIATALACEPRVLLLDEPVAGVPEGERQEIFDIINALPADVSVLLIEHDMDLVFNFAKSVTVLVNGAVFAEGDVQTISNDPRVKAVYLGEAAHG